MLLRAASARLRSGQIDPTRRRLLCQRPQLMPFQREGVAQLVDGRRGVILADEMGLGKTPQVICALQSLGATNVLIVCPKTCLLYTSPSPRDQRGSRMPSSA